MRYEIVPVQVRGWDTIVGASLRIETPRQPATEDEIQQLFQECGSDLERRQENGGTGICEIQIVLSSTEGLAPTNPGFLEALCGFLSEHSFDVEELRAPGRDLWLKVTVDTDQATARSVFDEGILEEATSRICGAFWQNDGLRSAFSKIMDVPYVLRQDVIDRVILDIQDDDFRVLPPLFRANLIARDARAEPSDVLQVGAVGVALTAVGTAFMDAVMDRALNVFPGISDRPHLGPPRFVVASERAASVVARRLQEYQRHPTAMDSVHVVSGTRQNLPTLDVDVPPLDGMSMFRAVLESNSLTLEGFRFSGDLSLTSAASTDSSLQFLTLRGCEISDPVHGAAALWKSLLSRGRIKLITLDLCDTPLPPGAMAALCRTLTAFTRSLPYLHLGDYPAFPAKEEPTLCDESVRHFFKVLPTTTMLRSVVFYHHIPTHMRRVVIDGVKDNYWLQSIQGMSFEEVDDDDDDDDDADEHGVVTCPLSEIKAYLTANARGRTTVYGAAFLMARGSADPEERRLRHRIVGEALQVLERLAASEDMDDETTRFLCVRLLLPALGGGAAIP